MPTARHFILTALPALGELGSVAPMGLADLVEHVGDESPWREPVEALILSDDLLLRESSIAGALEDVEPVVLSLQQVRGEAPLPERLFAFDDEGLPAAGVEVDQLWARYFRYVASLARAEKSEFLARWVGFEIALRNALARARARRLHLEESRYLVLPDRSPDDDDMSQHLAAWEAAETALAGWRAILRARWNWVGEHEAWFSFSLDELLVYVLRVIILGQWTRSEAANDVS